MVQTDGKMTETFTQVSFTPQCPPQLTIYLCERCESSNVTVNDDAPEFRIDEEAVEIPDDSDVSDAREAATALH